MEKRGKHLHEEPDIRKKLMKRIRKHTESGFHISTCTGFVSIGVLESGARLDLQMEDTNTKLK